jgi:hypothetical protein
VALESFIENLRAFDSHERGLLLAWAVGDETPDVGLRVALNASARNQIGSAIDRAPSPDAFVAMDYTLDWMYAATRWTLHPELKHRPQTWPGSEALTATSEDIDLVVAWEDQAGPHLVLLEAKGFTGWRNAQMAHKAQRLDVIFDERLANQFDVHFLLVGPTPSKGLKTADWPGWMKPGGRTHFLEINDPGLRFAVHRCDGAGNPKKIQPTHWQSRPRTWK